MNKLYEFIVNNYTKHGIEVIYIELPYEKQYSKKCNLQNALYEFRERIKEHPNVENITIFSVKITENNISAVNNGNNALYNFSYVQENSLIRVNC